MEFIRCLCTVISHKTVANFEKQAFLNQKLALLHKGLLSFDDFSTIYKGAQKQAFSEEQSWNYLIQLNLACPMDESPEKKRILVPCLISDEMEGELKAKEKELDGDAACVSIMYGFDKDKGSIGMFQKFLYTIAKSMLFGERGGHILMSYSQKVEQKKLGSVPAVNGILKWHTKGSLRNSSFS